MGTIIGEINLDKITLEQVSDFYEFLQGKHMPKELTLENISELTQQEAFSVIYYMQEIMEILPDKFEKCIVCGNIYDSYEEGTYIDENSYFEDMDGNEISLEFKYGNYCEQCKPNYVMTRMRVMRIATHYSPIFLTANGKERRVLK